MSTFTIKSVMPTGKTSQTYGTEYYTQFSEHEQPFPLWFKKEPEVGTTLEGEVVNGKFKKTKKEWNSQTQQSPRAATQSAPSAKPAYKDNSDGMRQGMCINNAANYVNGLEFEKALTDVEWARTVFSYANALYRLGDLTKTPEDSQEAPAENVDQTPLESVQAVFGTGVKVVK
jgi:hypothetical protein